MNEESPTIYIVIPVHNRLDATRECLNSLDSQEYTQFKVVLVDDGSSDGTCDYVRKEHPQVVMLEGDGNLWWTGATNLGVSYALQYARAHDYILTLNNDTVLPETYLATMVTLSRQMPRALIGSIALDHAQGEVLIDGGVRIHWWSAKFAELNIPPGHSGAAFYPVSVLPGRGTLIPVQVFTQIGLYDAQMFPHYAGDYDFSLRARQVGYVLILHPSCYLYSKTTLTGISNVHGKLSFGVWLGSFHSIRSPNNLRIRLRFGLRHAPRRSRPAFILCDLLRVTLGTLRNQLLNRPRSRRRPLGLDDGPRQSVT